MTKIINEFQGENRFLSNFYYSSTPFDGNIYPTSEHAYQAAKCQDPFERDTYLREEYKTPGSAKRLSKRLTKRPDWDDVKIHYMYLVLMSKFSYGVTVRGKLLQTGDAYLEEGNTWGDTFWGVCNGVGENHLGRLLMKVRNDLQMTLRGNV